MYGFPVSVLIAGLAWYFGAPAVLCIGLGVWGWWMTWLWEREESHPPSPTLPALKEPVIERDCGDSQRTVPTSTHELRAMPYNEYLQTPHWKRKREEKLRAAGHKCQVCNSGSTTLDVHHRTYDRRGDELDEDLIVLCRTCHDIFHEHGRLAR